ncbi:MAG: peptidylprolyl isomerase [Actinobacteria bacterium]|nr:peptidylprolyl isomerase [Actinomycetota bacterium]
MCDVIRTPRLILALGTAAALTLAACGDDSTASDGTGAGGDTPAAADGCAAADGSATKVTAFAAAPPTCIDEAKTYVATIETNNGTLHVELRDDIAPNTVNSFVNLARYHYFDGTTCHRAIRNFVVQCGDPTATGSGGPGYEFADELDKIEPYQIGSVAMANAGPNTNGSQFFIITGDDGASLPPNYTLFGQVIADDLGVVTTLDGLANTADGPPLQPIDIVKVSIDEK